MWTIAKLEVPEDVRVWASDGLAVAGVLRGGWGVATRLTIGKLGFLDIVDGVAGLWPRAVVATVNDVEVSYRARVARLHVRVDRDGAFEVTQATAVDGQDAADVSVETLAQAAVSPEASAVSPEASPSGVRTHAREGQAAYQARGDAAAEVLGRADPRRHGSHRHDEHDGAGHRDPSCPHCARAGRSVGQLKPLPTIAAADIDETLAMADRGLIPYRDLRAAPGRSVEQLTQLAAQLFPFCEARARNGDPRKVGIAEAARATARALATAVYDATTPGFARLALCDHLAYCGIGEAPHPLDLATLAHALWHGGWASYRPDDEDFMGSFGLVPAASEEELRAQLARGLAVLQARHAAARRVLTAALAALPRTSVMQVPQLYGAQVEPLHLGPEHFASGFVEFAGNAGPVEAPLALPLAQALASMLTIGATVTTKMMWRFCSSMPEALTYQNGVLLILTPPPDAAVWDHAACVTPLSADPNKQEWLVAPGTRFAVRSAGTYPMLGREVTMLSLQVLGMTGEAPRAPHHHHDHHHH
jgi:hypothetical protein